MIRFGTRCKKSGLKQNKIWLEMGQARVNQPARQKVAKTGKGTRYALVKGFMSKYYVACELGVDNSRVTLGHLESGKLNLSEVRKFKNSPIAEKDGLQWNIPELYDEILDGLRAVSSYEEAIESISCSSWAGDYLLFESDGSLITPALHHADSRTAAEMKKVLSKVPGEHIYAETGVQHMPNNTLFQLRAETFRRLSRASHLMPFADSFNYLLAGVPRCEVSLASPTQLYNPITGAWSDRLFNALNLPRKLFPPIIKAGTELGELRPEIAKDTGLDDVQVVASCSHEIAAALAGLPMTQGEVWAFLKPGLWTTMGTELRKPVINEASRRLGFTNEPGYGGTVRFSKPAMGLWVLEECRRFWKEKDREVDGEVLSHLAGSATPFESLVNLADPRFSEPGDMPLKIQAFCRETNQVVPRKPGPIVRCIFESLALLYRKTLRELQNFTGAEITKLYVLDGASMGLMNHFTANALQIPVVIAAPDAVAIGNILVQALAMGHIKTLDEAREIARNSFKLTTILPYATAWNDAYERLVRFSAAQAKAEESKLN
jgi:rhamnulokinase